MLKKYRDVIFQYVHILSQSANILKILKFCLRLVRGHLPLEGERRLAKRMENVKNAVVVEDFLVMHKTESSESKDGTVLTMIPIAYIADIKAFVFQMLDRIEEYGIFDNSNSILDYIDRS